MKKALPILVGALALIVASGIVFLSYTRAILQSEAQKEDAAKPPATSAPRPASDQKTPAQTTVPQQADSWQPSTALPSLLPPLAQPKLELKLAPEAVPVATAVSTPAAAPAAVKPAVVRHEARVVTVAGKIERVTVTPRGEPQSRAVAIVNPSSGEIVLIVRDAAYPEAFRKAAQMADGKGWSEIRGIRVQMQGLPAVRVQDVRSTT